MNLTATPLPRRDDCIEFPLQSVGFAHASQALGHRPLFAEDARGIALVLIRQAPMPLLRRWTSRVRIDAHAHDTAFLPALVEQLRRLGVPPVPGLQRILYHDTIDRLDGLTTVEREKSS